MSPEKRLPTVREVELLPADIDVLVQAAGTLGFLSPLRSFDPAGGKEAPSPALLGKDGRLAAELVPLAATLARPAWVVTLNAICPVGIVDTLVCHSPSGPSTALTHTDTKLWLQSPPPIELILAALAEGELPALDLPLHLKLSRHEAFVFWAMLDLLHPAGGAAAPARIALGDLLTAFDRPFDALRNLAAYYRDCLELPLPSTEETRAACGRLVDQGLIGQMGRDFLPSEELTRLAEALREIHIHAALRVMQETGGEAVATLPFWQMQALSGFGLLWYEQAGTVTITSQTREEMINLLGQALLDPSVLVNQG